MTVRMGYWLSGYKYNAMICGMQMEIEKWPCSVADGWLR